MRKVVVLCSGGFDSITLLHDLKSNLKNTEIHTLFFDYRQQNVQAEREKATNVSLKLGCIHHEVTLPEFSWTDSNFYGKGFNDVTSQYLEYRNLIFLSYALSLAQSVEATEVYLAILKSHHGYADTSPAFITMLNGLANLQGISVKAPYADLEKWEVLEKAYQWGVCPDEWFSCDVPIIEQGKLKPCGKCPDCKSLAEANEYLRFTPMRAFTLGSKKQFDKSVKSHPLNELRVLVNNKCQLKCKHCFYGFDDMVSEPLSIDDMKRVIDDAVNLGIKSIHYAGKEPLYDDTVFEYAEYVHTKYPNIKQSVVTNGLNVPKYINELLKYDVEVCLSVDTLSVDKIRTVSDEPIYEALKALRDNKHQPTVFIDIHDGNYDKIYNLMETLYFEYYIGTYHLRTLRNIGNAEKNLKPLSFDKLIEALEQAHSFSCDYLSSIGMVTVDVGCCYATNFITSDENMSRLIEWERENVKVGTNYIHDKFFLRIEYFCNKYIGGITVTPDGYILGCGAEVANKNYDKVSVGNVKDYSISELLLKGRERNCGIPNNGVKALTECKYKD